MTPIKYIGRHQTHKDNIYGTGVIFQKDETKLFEDDVAVKMLRHTDSYELGKNTKAIEVVKIDEEDTFYEDLVQDRKSISLKNEAELRAYATVKYRHEFPEGTTPAAMKKFIFQLMKV